MLDCAIIGDSIAVATHQLKPSCAAYAVSGISSQGWRKRYVLNDLTANVIIISLGSNDLKTVDTYSHLVAIREKIKSGTVYWVAPNEQKKPLAFRDVKAVASMYNDHLIIPKSYHSDNIHPTRTGLHQIVKEAK